MRSVAKVMVDMCAYAGGYIEDWSDCQILGCATSADGSGESDTTAELQAAFDFARNAYLVSYVPIGTYSVSEPIAFSFYISVLNI